MSSPGHILRPPRVSLRTLEAPFPTTTTPAGQDAVLGRTGTTERAQPQAAAYAPSGVSTDEPDGAFCHPDAKLADVFADEQHVTVTLAAKVPVVVRLRRRALSPSARLAS